MKTPPLRGLAALASAAALRTTAAFAPSSLPSRGLPPRSLSNAPRRSLLHRRTPAALRQSSSEDDGGAASCWNPDLRRRLAALSSLGLLETSYLTYDKLSGGGPDSLVGALCSAAAGGGASSCGDVLRGPYASLHAGGADVPLAALGAAAYGAVLLLSALPLLSSNSETTSGDGGGGALDGGNRVALLGATTLVASFSVFLVSLLVGVLHANCAFCLASAGISISLAALSWTSDMLPEAAAGDDAAAGLRRSGVLAGASSVGAATVAALVLFVGAGDVVGADPASLAASPASDGAGANGGTTLLASAAAPPAKSYAANVPPRITTRSTPYALSLAADLRALDARMYGAFWCSHCYDQKQSLGAEAMRSVPYVECDGEGYQNQRQTCKEKEVPGYPTWEIGGRLFPGERSLEELREIVDDVKAGR